MSGLHKDASGDDLHIPKTHATSHKTDGDDEIDVTSISFGSAELKPSALPAAMQLLYELVGIINTLENKISLLAQEAKRSNTNFDLNNRF